MCFIAVAAIAIAQAQIDPNVVTWRDYKAGAYSRATTLQTFEISTPAEFQMYVREMGSEGAGDAHDVQWGKEELIAIHLGTRNTSGYSVEVERIVKVKPNESQVQWAELTPIRGHATGQVVTSPWTIVRVNRPGTRMTFSGSKREGRLPGGIKIYPGYPPMCTCCEACIRANENRLPWRIYATGVDAPVLLGCTYVMDSPTDYAAYVHNYQMNGLGDGSDVDWAHERLLAIHLGRTIAGGYRIGIDHVECLDTGRIEVSYVEIKPTSLVGGSGNGPYLILRIPRVGSAVSFSMRMTREGDAGTSDSCCACPNCTCRH